VDKEDLIKIVATVEGAEYLPLAGMLQNGYGFAGYYNNALNAPMGCALVLVNARLVDLRNHADSRVHPRVKDFNEFIEEIVLLSYQEGRSPVSPLQDAYGKSIPLAVVNLAQVTVLYPLHQIAVLMKSIEPEGNRLPTFLDVDNKSVILRALRTKLW